MSPESTHKLMGFYMEVLILGVILQYLVSAKSIINYGNDIETIGGKTGDRNKYC